MPTLSDLPQEVLSMIVESAADSNHDAKTLFNICCLNRHFKSTGAPVLYSKWIYYGDQHSLASLLRFLRTILSNTHLASLVRSLDVQYWGISVPRAARDKFDISNEYLNILLEAFRLADIAMSEVFIRSAVYRHDRTPFMALLFTRLPNVSVMHGQVPSPCDIFLRTAMERAVEDPNERTRIQASPNLKELYLWSERRSPDVYGVRVPETRYQLHLQRLGPVFKLKRLERLSLFDVNVHNLRCNWKPATSSVKHLTLVNSQYATATTNITRAILAMPESLASLSFYHNVCPLSPPEPPRPLSISNAALYGALSQHKESLEYLDIYRDCAGEGLIWIMDNSKFGSLREFKSLRTLCIHLGALLGDGAEQPIGPFSLRDTLPSSLEELTLYTGNGQATDFNLEEQIRGVLFSRNSPQLKTVIVEDLSGVVNSGDKSQVSSTYPELEQACQEASICFSELPSNCLLKGGQQEPNFMNVKGQRQRREKHREARRPPRWG